MRAVVLSDDGECGGADTVDDGVHISFDLSRNGASVDHFATEAVDRRLQHNVGDTEQCALHSRRHAQT